MNVRYRVELSQAERSELNALTVRAISSSLLPASAASNIWLA